MGDPNWMGIGPGSVTGFGAGQADSGSGGVTAGVESAVATRANANAPIYSPDNPLFWVGLFLLATVGLIQASTHVKAGPISGSLSV